MNIRIIIPANSLPFSEIHRSDIELGHYCPFCKYEEILFGEAYIKVNILPPYDA